MKTLINKNNLGYFYGMVLELTETSVILTSGKNSQFNLNNATLVDADLPYPPLAGAWKWDGEQWVEYDSEAIRIFLEAEANQKKEEFNAQQKKLRVESYTKESDPIFFKSQRGEATHEEWVAKVNEIIERYPYQE